MERFKKKLPSIIFNTVEFLLLFGISTLVGIAWHEGLCVLLLFTLVRNLVGKGKHYKNPLLCLLWSSLVFSVIFISVRIDYILAVVLTICQTQRDVLENRYTTQLGLANLASETQECCCNTQKEILQSRYDNALGMQNLQAQLASCCLKIFKKVYKVVGNLISNNKLVLSH